MIYTPNDTSNFATLFRSSIQNLRFLSSSAKTPSFLILPSVAHDAQAAVLCGRRHGVRLRVRSGGHDNEGLSFVSFSSSPFAVLDLSRLRSIEVDANSTPRLGCTVGPAAGVLLDRRPAFNSSFKSKSDFVRKPISEKAWEGIWEVMMEGEEEPLAMILEPWGGRLWEIEDDAIAFPHRKGNLYNIQYFMRWFETQAEVTERHLTWMRRLYDYMAPHVSSNPRAAYLNYKDIDLGSSTDEEEGRTSYMEASAWGRRYFLHNFDELSKVKARVDPENYFWNEQGIPPFAA